ncbi:hypothetical protein [Sulfitobacter sp.]|uniref:hypothetical protein n=1 Tax=Sulfitobacter sp. TaxID=1903071 RepID=UPI0030027B56
MRRYPRWKPITHQRIMARSDKLWRCRKTLKRGKTVEHVLQVDNYRERFSLQNILILVGRIRRQNHPACMCSVAFGKGAARLRGHSEDASH